MFLDFTRPPTAKERAGLERRSRRLAAAEQSVRAAQKHMQGLTLQGAPKHLRLRHGFVYLSEAAPLAASDRSLPLPSDRPPATKVMSPRGSALRFHLIAAAEAQNRTRQGATPRNKRPLVVQDSKETGWTDLVATDAHDALDGRTAMTIRDKKVRHIQAALDRLRDAGLVTLPHAARGAGKYENFALLEETGQRGPDEDPVPYRVPRSVEGTVDLPMSFITHGWVHVLEDSEIALLLMAACRTGTVEPGVAAIPAGVRLAHYGIGRDAFKSHAVLSGLGLLDVREVDRHDDGRAEEYGERGASLHRLTLVPGGFAHDAVPCLREYLGYQSSRS